MCKKFKCDNCEFETDDQYAFVALGDCLTLGHRLDPGSIVPDGICPKCQAFVYQEREAADLLLWIMRQKPDAKIYIDDDGICIRAVGTDDYYELGGHTPDESEEA